MASISMVSVIKDGVTQLVCGHMAEYAPIEDLLEGHSANGYTLNTFSHPLDAVEYYSKYFPGVGLKYCGARE